MASESESDSDSEAEWKAMDEFLDLYDAREKEKARKEEEMRLPPNKKICCKCKGKGNGLPHAGATAAAEAAAEAAGACGSQPVEAAAEAAGGAAAAAELGSFRHFACQLLDLWEQISNEQWAARKAKEAEEGR